LAAHPSPNKPQFCELDEEDWEGGGEDAALDDCGDWDCRVGIDADVLAGLLPIHPRPNNPQFELVAAAAGREFPWEENVTVLGSGEGDDEAGALFWLLLAISLGLPDGALAVLEGLLSG